MVPSSLADNVPKHSLRSVYFGTDFSVPFSISFVVGNVDDNVSRSQRLSFKTFKEAKSWHSG